MSNARVADDCRPCGVAGVECDTYIVGGAPRWSNQKHMLNRRKAFENLTPTDSVYNLVPAASSDSTIAKDMLFASCRTTL
eukprot:8983387-Pyramimonas_sp.AAC.1